jgi:2-hydroxychromene-2-carboxylate isomerase
VRIYHDFASPFSYLGSTQIEAVCARQGATVKWVPMVLGGVFKAVGQIAVPIMAFPLAKRQLFLVDVLRFAEVYGVPCRFPSRFPIRSIEALRWVLAAEEHSQAGAVALTHRIYRAYWGEDRDIAEGAVLAELAREVHLDAEWLASRARESDLKARLFANTEGAVKQGVFGAPTFILDDGTVIWGQDRLPILEHLLANGAGAADR